MTKRAPFGEYIWLRCTRGCDTERHDIVDRFTGQLLSRKMYFKANEAPEQLTMEDKRKLFLKATTQQRRPKKKRQLPY